MVDLVCDQTTVDADVQTHAGERSRVALRPSPTHDHLPSLARSPTPGPSLLRSKSAVAMPVQSGVSITVSPHGADHIMHHTRNTKKRAPSKDSIEKVGSSRDLADLQRAPAGVVLESSDEDTDDDYLATSQTQRKIAELSAKRDAKAQPVPAGHRLDENGVVQPLSPTSRRRGIIMREMSESLRHSMFCYL